MGYPGVQSRAGDFTCFGGGETIWSGAGCRAARMGGGKTALSGGGCSCGLRLAAGRRRTAMGAAFACFCY